MPLDSQLPLTILAAVALPLLLVAVTSFAKFAIIGSVLRYALGTPKMPPTPVVLGVALVLSIHVMWPVVSRISVAAETATPAAPFDAKAFAAAAPGPIADFLRANARERDVKLFTQMRDRLAKESKTPALTGPVADAFSIYAPAFVLTELSEAFVTAFLIFIPFLVIDLIVSSVLLSVGSHMLSPTTISLPFKLLLFVLMDGWKVIIQGLILGYHY